MALHWALRKRQRPRLSEEIRGGDWRRGRSLQKRFPALTMCT